MTTISGLYERFRLLIHEGFKFIVVGGIGAIITIGGAAASSGIVGRYAAVTIFTILATVATFLGNRYWTFRDRKGHGTAHESVVFFVLNGVGLLIYYACIGLIQDVGGLKGRAWYAVALVVGTALGTLFRFWSYRKWVWMQHQPRVPGPAGDDLPESLDPAPAGSVQDDQFSAQPPADPAPVRSGPGAPRRG